jgi:hypothetical protein
VPPQLGERESVTVEAPRPASFDQFEARLVVTVENFVGDPAVRPTVNERQRVRSVPCDAYNRDDHIGQNTPQRGVSLKIFEFQAGEDAFNFVNGRKLLRMLNSRRSDSGKGQILVYSTPRFQEQSSSHLLHWSLGNDGPANGCTPRENAILFRGKNAEAAMNAYVEANQRVAEEAMNPQTTEAGVVEGAPPRPKSRCCALPPLRPCNLARPSYCPKMRPQDSAAWNARCERAKGLTRSCRPTPQRQPRELSLITSVRGKNSPESRSSLWLQARVNQLFLPKLWIPASRIRFPISAG